MYNVIYTKTGESVESDFVLTTSKGYHNYFIGKVPARFFFKFTAWWCLRKALKRSNWRLLERGNKNKAPYYKEFFKIMEAPHLN